MPNRKMPIIVAAAASFAFSGAAFAQVGSVPVTGTPPQSKAVMSKPLDKSPTMTGRSSAARKGDKSGAAAGALSTGAVGK